MREPEISWPSRALLVDSFVKQEAGVGKELVSRIREVQKFNLKFFRWLMAGGGSPLSF